MDNKQADELFHLLEKYELSIAHLYETYALVLPEAKNAWLGFAKEEHLHAKWINKLYTYVNDGKIQREHTKITIQSTRTAIAYIENQTNKALNEEPDLIQFINFAIDIEQSLLENPFFKVFELNTPETKKVRSQLEEATSSHIKRLVDWRDSLVKA